MSMYLKVGASPVELVAAAEDLKSRGEALKADLARLIADIESRENGKVIPGDDFGRAFTATYQRPSAGPDGTTVAANDATKQAALSMAEMMISLGDAVSKAMRDYLTIDAESQTDIGSTAA